MPNKTKIGMDDFLILHAASTKDEKDAGAKALQALLYKAQPHHPLVMLPSDDRLLSECAAELGAHLADVLYLYNDEVVALEGSTARPVGPQAFRTVVEDYTICTRLRSSRKGTVEVGVTMSVEDARGILASRHFKEKLRPLKRIATCRQPVLRANGRVELLPEDYDVESQTVTVSDVVYPEDMPFEDGVAVIRDLFGEFEFADGERSLSVAVTSLIGLFAAQLVDVRSLRPVYAFTKNAPGAGATLLASCAVVPVLGYLPAFTKPKEDEEMKKTITAALRSGQTVIALDNVKGRLDLPSLEKFVTSPTHADRLLGASEMYEGENNITVFVTANGMSTTEDMRRRMLFAELHLSAERPEDRVFKRKLDEPILKAMRPQILAACWAVVRHWDTLGRPAASRTHSFASWDAVMGGIVEAAKFCCPFAPAAIAAVADEDGDSMCSLAQAMRPGYRYTSHELAELCRKEEAFINIVGDGTTPMTRAQLSAFGYVLARWNNRLVGTGKFFIEGKARHKRFFVGLLGDGEHAKPAEEAPPPAKFPKFTRAGRGGSQ